MKIKRGNILRAKATFMIFIVLCFTFTLTNLDQISADETGNVCCQQTIPGDSCLYTSPDQCDSNYLVSQTSCEQTTFCEPGVCISDLGQCSEGVAKGTCEELGYTWQSGTADTVAACQQECCVIAEAQCGLTTQKQCETLTVDLEDLDTDWRDVADEQECLNICENSAKGCCVTGKDCSYTTRGLCENPVGDFESSTGFFEGTFCGDVATCPCVPRDNKQCVGEDVYWFDSCGNQEDIAEDCSIENDNFCGYDDQTEDFACLSTQCVSTFDGVYSLDGNEVLRNTHDEKIGGARSNGESWCLYESPAGGWFDRPGSQHYVATCLYGKEVIESCKDYREEVCIQFPYTDFNDYDILDPVTEWAQVAGDEYSGLLQEAGARCFDNGVYQDLVNANVTTTPKGSKFWEGDTQSCQAGTRECPVTFVKGSTAGSWECVNNCHCLTQEWVDESASWCSLQGDCGSQFNIADEYSGDGFTVTRSQDFVGKTTKEGEIKESVYVGMDFGCVNEFGEVGDNQDCSKLCKKDIFGEEECVFISSPSLGATTLLGENYGVHGGLVGVSRSITQYALTEIDLNKGVGKVVAGVAGSLASTVALGAAKATLAAAAASGSGALSQLAGSLGIAAASSSTVPVVGWFAAAVLIIIAVVVTLLSTGGQEATVLITAQCEAWQAPTGSDNCGLCDIPVSQGGLAIDDGNGNILPGYECTEYQCRSLGQTCEFISDNEGTPRQKCISTQGNDVNHPVVQNAFLLGQYKDVSVSFNVDDSLVVNQKVEPYTRFEFGIELDEVAQCKVDTDPKENYGEMENFFPDSFYDINHNQSWILTPEEEYNFFIRCTDLNGNVNSDAFVVKVSTTAGTDITPPIIEATSIANNGFIPAGINETTVAIFVNEPANCKWDLNNVEYDFMENDFICSDIPSEATPLYDNSCTTVLPIGEGTNSYFFACEDLAENANTQNFPYILQSTQPLKIGQTLPNGTIFQNSIDLFVQTVGGAEGGKAMCSYNNILFFKTDSNTHIQPLQGLAGGEYDYNVQCVDVAGNKAKTQITFNVEVDDSAPTLTGLYVEGSDVHYLLDEQAACELFFEEFTYGQGTAVSGSFPLTQLPRYYLICQDQFGNQGSYTINI